MNDTQYTIHERIENWKAYLQEFYAEREKILMRVFRERNGFDATDDDAKRNLIDTLYFDVFHRYPRDDEERNRYCSSAIVDRLLMKIGWKPNRYSIRENDISDAFSLIE